MNLIGIKKRNNHVPSVRSLGKLILIPGRLFQPDPIRKRKSYVKTGKTRSFPYYTNAKNLLWSQLLFDQIGKLTGVRDDLKACFPDTYKQIFSVAYYLILEEKNSLIRFSHWQKFHAHPYGQDLPSQQSSDLFQSITVYAE